MYARWRRMEARPQSPEPDKIHIPYSLIFVRPIDAESGVCICVGIAGFDWRQSIVCTVAVFAKLPKFSKFLNQAHESWGLDWRLVLFNFADEKTKEFF